MDSKWGKIIIILVVIGLFIGCFFIGDSSDGKKLSTSATETTEEVNSVLDNAQKESEAIKEDEMDDLDEIDIDEYLDMYADDDASIVLIARPTCSYCTIAEPIIRKIAKDYDVDVNYLNTDEFDEDDQNELINSDDFFAEGYGTPLLLVVGEDSIIGKVDGLTDTKNYIDFFKKHGFIEE